MIARAGPASTPSIGRLVLAFTADAGTDGQARRVDDLADWLGTAGVKVQPLLLPRVEQGGADLRSLLSLRLTPLRSVGDALLCLDIEAAILRHDKKWVWPDRLPDPKRLAEGSFADRVQLAGLKEARGVFGPAAQAKRLRAGGLPASTIPAADGPACFRAILKAMAA